LEKNCALLYVDRKSISGIHVNESEENNYALNCALIGETGAGLMSLEWGNNCALLCVDRKDGSRIDVFGVGEIIVH
jgi:hypothetical protein